MLRVCPVTSFPASLRDRSHPQPPCTRWTFPSDPDGPPAGLQASCALCSNGMATISACLRRTKRSNLAREAREGAKFPRDPRTGRDSTSPSDPFGGHSGNWRHCADRHRRGQGAPRSELRSQWQRDDATPASVNLNFHIAFHSSTSTPTTTTPVTSAPTTPASGAVPATVPTTLAPTTTTTTSPPTTTTTRPVVHSGGTSR